MAFVHSPSNSVFEVLGSIDASGLDLETTMGNMSADEVQGLARDAWLPSEEYMLCMREQLSKVKQGVIK